MNVVEIQFHLLHSYNKAAQRRGAIVRVETLLGS